MGQTTSTQGDSTENSTDSRCSPQNLRFIISSADQGERFTLDPQHDFSSEIPDECLGLIFQSLCAGDRKQCSLVCRRWYSVEGQTRHRLALNGASEVTVHLSAILTRFDSLTKLSLRCDRRSVSINDSALVFISLRCPNLTRLKLRGCREISNKGMLALAQNCKSLRKFSCGSCVFGAKGLNALLSNSYSLEELSIKRLRGINDGFTDEIIRPGIAAKSLRSITLKELYNGQCYWPLIIGSENLRILKIMRCLGDWDRLLENFSIINNCLIEIHLDRVQVSDVGLMALSKCPDLENLHLVRAPDCSNDGISAIAEACRRLRKLHIDGWRTNRIGDEGLVSIAKNSVNLVELALIGVNPSAVTLSALASNCRKLERLALCGSETIGDREISCIAAKCLALKKLCIKGCRVTDSGMEMFAFGCPNLVKIKVRKCDGVTGDVAAWLRARRVSLAVNLDADNELEAMDAGTNDGGAQDDGAESSPIIIRAGIGVGANVSAGVVDVPSTSGRARSFYMSRFSIFAGRTPLACAREIADHDSIG